MLLGWSSYDMSEGMLGLVKMTMMMVKTCMSVTAVGPEVKLQKFRLCCFTEYLL